MSPVNWGIVPANIDIFVYPNVRTAVRALVKNAHAIHARHLEEGTAELLGEHLLFRGQSEVTANLLPTRLRGPWTAPAPRQRYDVADPPKVKFNGIEFPSVAFSSGDVDPREIWGDWYEEVSVRDVDEMLQEVPQEELARRDAEERRAIERASDLPEIAGLDDFRRRAAVRHYGEVRSQLLDVTTNPEVAAFFATGGGGRRPARGSIGMLWAIDLNFLGDLFEMKISSVPGGEKIVMSEMRDKWGDNKQMFEKQGVLPARMEVVSSELPFRRPQAQHGRFLSFLDEDGASLPGKTEFTWWSILERRSYACAFLQDGATYENASHNVTTGVLLPNDEPLALALAPKKKDTEVP